MFELTRQRREARRTKKLEDVFKKMDKAGEGRITAEQLIALYRDNEIDMPNLEEGAHKLAGANGEISVNDFIGFARNTDLAKIEFHDRVFSKGSEEPKREQKLKVDDASRAEALPKQQMDKVEMAFRKFDVNKDGFLSREEYYKMMKNVERDQADRIFRALDKAGDDKISLPELRALLDKYKGQV